MRELSVRGAWTSEPKVWEDDRGSFSELFQVEHLQQDVGYRFDVAQVNCSVSRRGVIRGIHFADVPPGQAKYVTCVSGTILDAVIDLRTGSPTFRHHELLELDGRNRTTVFIPEGLGHAFMALSTDATIVYLCSSRYNPASEHSVNPMDPALGIQWPKADNLILSVRDINAPLLRDAMEAGLLPEYEKCVARKTGELPVSPN